MISKYSSKKLNVKYLYKILKYSNKNYFKNFMYNSECFSLGGEGMTQNSNSNKNMFKAPGGTELSKKLYLKKKKRHFLRADASVCFLLFLLP